MRYINVVQAKLDRCSENIQQIFRNCFATLLKSRFCMSGGFPVNLLHIFRAPFTKNTSGRLFLLVLQVHRFSQILDLFHFHLFLLPDFICLKKFIMSYEVLHICYSISLTLSKKIYCYTLKSYLDTGFEDIQEKFGNTFGIAKWSGNFCVNQSGPYLFFLILTVSRTWYWKKVDLERFYFLILNRSIIFSCNYFCIAEILRSSRPEVVLGKGVLKICSKFTGEHPCRSLISIELLS